MCIWNIVWNARYQFATSSWRKAIVLLSVCMYAVRLFAISRTLCLSPNTAHIFRVHASLQVLLRFGRAGELLRLSVHGISFFFHLMVLFKYCPDLSFCLTHICARVSLKNRTTNQCIIKLDLPIDLNAAQNARWLLTHTNLVFCFFCSVKNSKLFIFARHYRLLDAEPTMSVLITSHHKPSKKKNNVKEPVRNLGKRVHHNFITSQTSYCLTCHIHTCLKSIQTIYVKYERFSADFPISIGICVFLISNN